MITPEAKKGKFRPYLLYMGVPSALISCVFAFLPFETMSYDQRLWSLFITYMLLQLCYPFYDQAYTTLAQVMSPDSNERAEVITISTFIYSIAPTLANLFEPIIAGFTGGMEHIGAYRIIIPVFGISGCVIGMLSYTGTKERIIVAKDYTPKVPFWHGIIAGMKNKYQWGRSITSWFVLLQTGIQNITTWYFYYGIKDILNLTTEQQGVLNGTLVTILGASAYPALLFSPIIIKKIGKRNLVIIYTVCNILCMIGMYFSIRNIWALYVFLWLRSVFTAFPIINDCAMNADVLDYQQYKTGDRLEGLMSQVVTFIGAFVTMGVTYFVQTIVMQNRYGLVDNNDDLYLASFREPLSKAMILIAIVGYVLSLIPFITLYTLTEEEHKSYIEVLKIRAALEDYADNNLAPGQLEEAKNIYFNAVEEYNACVTALNNAKSPLEKRKMKKKIKALEIIVLENKRFENKQMIKKTQQARELVSHSVEELYGISEPTMDAYNEAMAMSEATPEERKLKSKKLKMASKEFDRYHKKAFKYIEAKKLIKQYEYYSNWNSIFNTQLDKSVNA
ncbi:MAG: MFS transporter [Eubacterium sp.]